MACLVQQLNVLTLKRLTAPGLYPDGGGLHLQVTGAGGRSWVFRFWIAGRERRMGLGSLKAVTLAEAREAARQARQLRFQGSVTQRLATWRYPAAAELGGLLQTRLGCGRSQRGGIALWAFRHA
ncbi:Arm DNA-binding domain-containing protein [Caulobacter sp. RL271]|uniref:Arm DNA-binding domain-containing protein n=1 Tax=Caulobacter sp. RL271 TaxID=3458546 RepID=UPI00339D8CCF